MEAMQQYKDAKSALKQLNADLKAAKKKIDAAAIKALDTLNLTFEGSVTDMLNKVFGVVMSSADAALQSFKDSIGEITSADRDTSYRVETRAKKSKKLLMKRPTALTKVSEEDGGKIFGLALEQLLASVFDMIFV